VILLLVSPVLCAAPRTGAGQGRAPRWGNWAQFGEHCLPAIPERQCSGEDEHEHRLTGTGHAQR
ncbi:MAG: hypothetical protein LC799_08940, partial [Actinobacteria bacterium]|nr:hypothetical protein [Actinomycetota bacterium]